MPLRSGRLVLLFKNALGRSTAGGYSPLYSMLEHLAYMKFVSIGASGGYNFNFSKYGINAGNSAVDLQKADEDSEQLITLESRLDWPDFYQKYKAQIDELFDKSVEKMFSQNGVSNDVEADEFEIEDIDEI